MLPYVDINVLWLSVTILWEIHVMRHKYHLRWLRFHLKRMLITGLGQKTLDVLTTLLINNSREPFVKFAILVDCIHCCQKYYWSPQNMKKNSLKLFILFYVYRFKFSLLYFWTKNLCFCSWLLSLKLLLSNYLNSNSYCSFLLLEKKEHRYSL